MPETDPLRDVEQLARELYGDPLPVVSGVLHVVSAVHVASGPLHVIAINQHAPASKLDFFVLNFWRANSDAIVTTAKMMRDEPQLSHELQGPYAAGLAAYRAQVLRKTTPPLGVVLTHNGEISPEHGMFADALHYVLLTVPERTEALRARTGARAETVGMAELDVRRAVRFAQERGARTVLIEAGPSTAGQLYGDPSQVDELLLSRYEGTIAPAAIGGTLPPDERLFAGLTLASDTLRQEPSGPWRFQRYVHSR